MIICGIKLTHDSAVALLEDGKLIFSVELEKLYNQKRHTRFTNPEIIEEILTSFGYDFKSVDTWVVDGWHSQLENSGKNYIEFNNEYIYVNNYQNRLLNLNEENVVFGENSLFKSYNSYTHTYTHLCAAYCTSPFSINNETSYLLLFDGGTKPVLYYYNGKSFIFYEEILKFGGDIYADVSSRFEPFTNMRSSINGKDSFNLHFVGKVMAYIALGKIREEIIKTCYSIYDSLTANNTYDNNWQENRKFAKEFENQCKGKYSDADCLTSFHFFLQQLLVNKLVAAIKKATPMCENLCLSGGCMLNIKWNSEIRRRKLFKSIYAPPFINDSGSAIGSVCAEWFRISGQSHIEWCTYSGMTISNNAVLNYEWIKQKCSIKELAFILASTEEAVVFINGRSELGPRALGNRSILADPRKESIKQVLNEMKCRESYRPVAPICIEEEAKKYFIPGTPDKYMLFEHIGTQRCNEIPAVIHIDGTARLQTVSKKDNPVIFELLNEFKKITGIPILCNTSANLLGCGFFSDIESIQKWGKCNYIWCDGYIYIKKEKIHYFEKQGENNG